MAGNHRNGTPIYQRIQNAIRKRIDAAELRPGDAVASERELARTHKVSLMTARHALTSLEREGIVERRRGAGTFVAPPKIHFNRLMSYTEQMASRGLSACSRLLCVKIIDPEPEIAARLALPPNSSLVKVERLRQAADEPFALETCYLSGKEFGGRSPWDWRVIPCSAPWNEISELRSRTPMKRSMRPPPTRVLPSFLACRAALHCCGFARRSIPRRAKPRCMCSAFTGLIATHCSSGVFVLPLLINSLEHQMGTFRPSVFNRSL